MKEIPLTQGKVALVDDDDYERVNQFKWCVSINDSTVYASRLVVVNSKRICILMHRFILKIDRNNKLETDHIDGNGLNNLKSNLRLVTRQQNSMNRKPKKGSTSIFKGVHWSNHDKKWIVRIKINGRKIWVGQFNEETEAALAYDKIAKEIFGEYARLNFNGEVMVNQLMREGHRDND